MTGPFLIGLGGGLAALAMFVSPLGGTLLASPLLLLSTVPVIIVTLGWGTRAGVIATAVGSVSALIGLGWPSAIAFLLAVGLPATVTATLLGLARPADEADPARGQVWFPLDPVLLLLALWTGAIGALALFVIGFDPAQSLALFSDGLTEMMRQNASAQPMPDRAQIEATAALMIAVMPYAFSGLWLIGLLVSLWLGAWVVRRSDRLARPWPNLMAFRAHPWMIGAFALALLMAGTSGVFALGAKPFVGALAVAHAAVGLAVIHARTVTWPLRTAALAIFYGLMFLIAIPGFLALALGIADRFFDLRGGRPSGRAGTPPPSS
jgi:hypothetical protein